AELTGDMVENLQAIAVQTYQALHCTGMARVDFFITEDNSIIINEVNPIPGFADISLFARNWQASGLSFPKVLHDLIQLALEKHQKKQEYSLQLIELSAATV
ncbi:unnamed protein product, partial [marine sediment metagenome]